MLNVHFVYLGAAIGLAGCGAYLRDTFSGRVQPNRVTWGLWALIPGLALAVQLHDKVGLRALMTATIVIGPFLIFVASFSNGAAPWRIGPLDVVCAVLSVGGLIAWLLTRHGTFALLASVIADFLAGVPTLAKAWRAPQSETPYPYIGSTLNALITVLTISTFTTAVALFPIYIFCCSMVLTTLVVARIGPRYRAHFGRASLTRVSPHEGHAGRLGGSVQAVEGDGTS